MKEPSELNEIVENLTQELKRGTLVLGVLLCTTDEVYGYALVTSLQERGIPIEQNTLYPLLRRLEKQGLLESSWHTDESRPRRYYRISDAGLTVRERLIAAWQEMDAALRSCIKNTGDSPVLQEGGRT